MYRPAQLLCKYHKKHPEKLCFKPIFRHIPNVLFLHIYSNNFRRNRV